MEITQVTIMYSRTQSLGNYNNIKPGVTLTAVVEDGDNAGDVAHELLAVAKSFVHREIDDALEADGGAPIFWDGPRYALWEALRRRLLIITPLQQPPPAAANWNCSDPPSRRNNYHGQRLSATLTLAYKLLDGDYSGYSLIDCSDGDLSRIPDLPDPGPEPMWHRKDLSRIFEALRIRDEAVWEELAALDWVDKEYLRNLYRHDAEVKLSREELIELIKTNSPWPPLAEAEPEERDADDEQRAINDYYDDDYEDYYDDDSEF